MASRILAVLAATLLIGAFALVTLAPLDMTLADALYELDPTVLLRLQHAVMSHLGRGPWQILAVPLLVRPTWLLPVALGLVCVGGAISIATPPSARTRQRRS